MFAPFRRLLARVRQPEQPLPPWEWGFALLLIAVYALSLLLSLLFVGAVLEGDSSPADAAIIAYAHLMGGLLTLPLIWQYVGAALRRRQSPRTVQAALRLHPPQGLPLWGVLLFTFSLAVLVDLIGLIVGVPLSSLPTPLDSLSRQDTLPFIVAALVIVLLRPLVEELLFRGLLYSSLIKRMAQPAAILLSALVFAAFHWVFASGDWWWGLVQPLILGMIAGTARASTQSTQAAIGTHFMFGLFTLLRAIIP